MFIDLVGSTALSAQLDPEWELRAACALARLLVDQGQPQRAADLLSPIYRGFTEDFDAPDLVQAKTLLDTLRV